MFFCCTEALIGHAWLLFCFFKYRMFYLSIKQADSSWQSHCRIWDYTVAALFSSVIHIRMISEGPWDTEDWCNDAEHSALITEIKHNLKYI